MADGFSAEVKGLKEVDEKLVLLGKVAGEKVMRTSLYTATKPLLDAAQSNITAIQRGSGALAKATRRVYMRSASDQNRFVVAIAPKAKDRIAVALANLHYKRKRPIRGVFWGHLVEWGFTLRGGRRVGGKQVFTRAVSSRASAAIELFRVTISKNVERALKKQQPK